MLRKGEFQFLLKYIFCNGGEENRIYFMKKNTFYLKMLEGIISEHRISRSRREMIDALRYYRGEHDILKRCRTAIGADGSPIRLEHLPCRKIVNNQYGRLVDQKINYSLGRPLTVDCDDAVFSEYLKKYCTGEAQKFWRRAAIDAINCGIAWIHPYINESGEFALKRFDPVYSIPLWADEEHTELDAFIRICPSERYEGRNKRTFERIFVYTKCGIEEYEYSSSRLSLISDMPYHFTDSAGNGYLWEKVPVIAVRYNFDSIPMIRRAKCLQDALNELMSDFCDNMAENSRNTVLVLKNFDGEDLGEFRRNLATYGAVKVRSDMGGDGGVDTLRIEVNADNYSTLQSQLSEALTECCRGFDSHDSRLGSNPNRMNILAIYSDIDLDANGFETELKCAFSELFGYLRSYLFFTGHGDFRSVSASIILNRDLLVNESETISSLEASRGILSERTLLSSHPMVNDVETELERLEHERSEK